MSLFNIPELLESYIGFKGLPFSGGFIPEVPATGFTGSDFDGLADGPERKTYSNKGTLLRKQDALGIWYFLPVFIESGSLSVEIENALVSITTKKRIEQTPMQGRRGTVKELISAEDYQIEIAGVLTGSDWPEEKIEAVSDIYNLNEAVTLRCALTDIFLETDDKVVFTDMELPQMSGTENAQIIRLRCLSDQNFELVIK